MKKKLAILAALSLLLTACGDDSNGSSSKPEKPSVCGDSAVGSDEACDDGNTEAGDGCSADCKTVEDGWNCPKSGGKCTQKSVEPENLCGNGVIDGDEKCDDKNTVDGDGCSADCMTIEENYHCDEAGKPCVLSSCGNGELDPGEACDDGDDNVDYDVAFGSCSTSCHEAHYCGDGLWDEIDQANGEECDVGVDTSSQYGGCTTDCLRSLYCGDGVIQPEYEQCDDGNESDGDGCSSACKLETGFACQTVSGKSECKSLLCGNGVLDEGEQCDDGNREAGDGCSAICLMEKLFVCEPDAETGLSVCTSVCGNGTLEESLGEQCDDGNTEGGDGCSATCTMEPGYYCNEKGCSARACGDGIIAGNEECDDGNINDEDGCSKFCRREHGWNCPKAGEACVMDACGDGLVTGDETCDEGHTEHPENQTAGCVNCQVQMGWKCPTPGASCEAAVCGNGILEGAETCEVSDDDPSGCCIGCAIQPHCLCDADGKNCVKGECGNGIVEAGEECDNKDNIAGKGCSPVCTIEPIYDCGSDGKCKPRCGDGLTLWEAGEECDDGNLTNGDGCSSECKIEHGYDCTKFSNTEVPSVLNLPIVYRDFRGFKPDSSVNNSSEYTPASGTGRGFFTQEAIDALAPECFSRDVYRKRNLPRVGSPIPDFQGNGCYSWNYCSNVIYPELNQYGRPVLRPSNEITWSPYVTGSADRTESCAQLYTCPQVFDYWYRDSDMNITVKTTLPLSHKGNGTYQYSSGGFWPLQNKGFNSNNAAERYDSAKDNLYGLFTSEFQSYFKFNGGETLRFTGDDDVWVFFNGHLALEFAGIHGDWGQNITLTEEKAKEFGMYPGGIYSLQMFHAERCQGGSTYTLTMSGFVNMGTSTCAAKCGDGVVRGDEECDYVTDNLDDVEEQHANGCNHCKLAPWCGNGKVEAGEACDPGSSESDWCFGPGSEKPCQIMTCGNGTFEPEHEKCDKSAPETAENKHENCSDICRFVGCGDGVVQSDEVCDDGNLSDDDMCTSKCTLPYCGDGLVSPAIGEVCDDGVNDGSYGGCGFGCTYESPKCGDGIVDNLSGEECDDGAENNVGGYGKCNSECHFDTYCGDGIVQEAFEQCDEGADNGNSSCTKSCEIPVA